MTPSGVYIHKSQQGFQKGHKKLRTNESYKKQGKKMEREKNSQWKGENTGYIPKHLWIYFWKGKPKICIHCKATYKERKLCWANKDHKYRRNLDDYISLCYSCHKKYDLKRSKNKKLIN